MIASAEVEPQEDISDSVEVPRASTGSVATAEALQPAQPRTVATMLIALVMVLTAVRLGAAFFIPLLLSLFLNYALSPTVHRLERWHVPRPIGAAIVIALVITVISGAVYRVATDAVDILEQLPRGVQKLRLAITRDGEHRPGALEHVQEAATEFEKLANATTAPKSAGPAAPARAASPAPAPAAPPTIDVRSLVLVGTSSMAVFVGQVGTALLLTFFLLNAGDLFRRKLMQTLGPSLTRRKTALKILQDVDSMNQHYFAVVLFINILVGIATGLALWMIGLERPLVWGIAATVLHTIPYLGSAVVAVAAALTAYTQFSDISSTLLAATLPIAISIVLGMGVQTWLMGRAARMNSPTVFIALLFWGMLWGAWGLLLAVPVMVVIKTICDHVPRLKAFSELLGPLEKHRVVE